MAHEQKRIDKVVASLERVKQQTKQMVFNMSQSLTEFEIIQSFNQQTFDLFNTLYNISKKMNMEKECKIAGYKVLFENALKINVKMPIDKYTLTILEFAAEIYNEDEDCFLKMTIPDANVTVGNEFSIIRSDMFKRMWKDLDSNDKNSIKETIIPLTTYAHAYLYKVLIKTKPT